MLYHVDPPPAPRRPLAGIGLTRRGGMYRVKTLKRERQGIGLMKLKGIMGLRLNIHPYHLKPCPVITHGCTPSATEQVKQSHASRFSIAGQSLGRHTWHSTRAAS